MWFTLHQIIEGNRGLWLAIISLGCYKCTLSELLIRLWMEMCLHYLGLLEHHNLGDQNISTLKGGLKSNFCRGHWDRMQQCCLQNSPFFEKSMPNSSKLWIFSVAKNIIDIFPWGSSNHLNIKIRIIAIHWIFTTFFPIACRKILNPSCHSILSLSSQPQNNNRTKSHHMWSY